MSSANLSRMHINHYREDQHRQGPSLSPGEAGDVQQFVYYVRSDKKPALLKQIIEDRSIRNAIIFARTTFRAEVLARDLAKAGIAAHSFHADKSQHELVKTLESFREKHVHILVATDSAASRTEIPVTDFVINYELPDSAETYKSRLMRTERGQALSLCDEEEKRHLNNINRVLINNLQVIGHPFA
jgi:ATP-dependent RNA helicase RhlE